MLAKQVGSQIFPEERQGGFSMGLHVGKQSGTTLMQSPFLPLPFWWHLPRWATANAQHSNLPNSIWATSIRAEHLSTESVKSSDIYSKSDSESYSGVAYQRRCLFAPILGSVCPKYPNRCQVGVLVEGRKIANKMHSEQWIIEPPNPGLKPEKLRPQH